MSRLQKKPLVIPEGVEVSLTAGVVKVKAGKAALQMTVHPTVKVAVADNQIQVTTVEASRLGKAMGGTTCALIRNMIQGVTDGFSKQLIIEGVGYRANLSGKNIELNLGYSHPIKYKVPEGIALEVTKQNHVFVRGADRQQVGQVAAELRSFRPPEPYKGKGVRYADEVLIRKVGKRK